MNDDEGLSNGIRWGFLLKIWGLPAIVIAPSLSNLIGFAFAMVGLIVWCAAGVYLSVAKLTEPELRRSRLLLNVAYLAGVALLLLVVRGLQNLRFHI